MITFTDELGRAWHVVLDYAAVRRVKSQLGVDLFKVLDDNCDLFQKLSVDIELAVNLLFALVADQAEKAGVSDEDFGRGLAGDAIDRAMEALVAETVAFFPKHRRAILEKIRQKMNLATETMMSLALTRMETLTPQRMERELAAALDRALAPSDISGKPPESAASTPVPSP